MSRKVVHELDSEVDEQELETPEQGAEWDRREAATFLGVSPMTVRRLEKEGRLTPRTKAGTRGGKIVYDAQEVAKLKGTPTLEVAEEDEMKAKDLVAAAVNLAQQSSDHAQMLLQLVEGPANELLKMALEENGALRARVSQLEEKRIEDFEKMEVLRGKQHERELELLRFGAKNERQTALMSVVIDNAPRLMNQIVASGQAPQMFESLTGLAKSLNPDQVMKLMGILDDDQQASLAKVLDTVNTSGETVKNKDKEEPHELLK